MGFSSIKGGFEITKFELVGFNCIRKRRYLNVILYSIHQQQQAATEFHGRRNLPSVDGKLPLTFAFQMRRYSFSCLNAISSSLFKIPDVASLVYHILR